jgi:hypothetical protein
MVALDSEDIAYVDGSGSDRWEWLSATCRQNVSERCLRIVLLVCRYHMISLYCVDTEVVVLGGNSHAKSGASQA